MKPAVLIAPDFREVDEVFDAPTWERLNDLVDVRWGRNGPMPRAEFARQLVGAVAIVFGTWHYGPDVLEAHGTSVRHVFEVAGSFDHPTFDYATCFERGITVAGCAPAFGPAVAEMALALSLAAARLVARGDGDFRRGEEKWLHEGTVGATTLFEKTVGFLGAGGLARALQPLLEPFDVTFLAHDPWLDAAVLRRRGLEPVGLRDLFVRSDLLYVLAVPSADNRHLVSRDLMELLDVTDVLTLVSRAHLVDFEALTDLVLAGRFRAAIDVFPQEPLDPDHRIRQARGAVLSAHRAGAIPEALHEIGRMVVDDLESHLTGQATLRMQYATPGLIDRLAGGQSTGRAAKYRDRSQ